MIKDEIDNNSPDYIDPKTNLTRSALLKQEQIEE
jgi:hypothetical protein